MSISAPHIAHRIASPMTPRQKNDNTAAATEGGFSAQLDQAIGVETSTQSIPANARELAESLSLQMLQATLALGGELATDSSSARSASQPLASVTSLLQAYQANLAGGGQSSPSPLPTDVHKQSTLIPSAEAAAVAAPLARHSGRDRLEAIIAKASGQYGVDADLIRAVIKTESNFNPQAVSPVGARGLMQLMPATARGLGVSDSFNPEQNVMAGTRFLRDLLKRYDGNLDSALAAYNWGPGNVDRRPDQLPRETRDYLVRVKQSLATYSA